MQVIAVVEGNIDAKWPPSGEQCLQSYFSQLIGYYVEVEACVSWCVVLQNAFDEQHLRSAGRRTDDHLGYVNHLRYGHNHLQIRH